MTVCCRTVNSCATTHGHGRQRTTATPVAGRAGLARRGRGRGLRGRRGAVAGLDGGGPLVVRLGRVTRLSAVAATLALVAASRLAADATLVARVKQITRTTVWTPAAPIA